MKLDLGCGPGKMPGTTGVDIVPAPGVDVVHDLNDIPWPFEAGTVTFVNARHIIEHVDDIALFMREIHRVCSDGAEVVIETPHFTSLDSWADPTHRWHLSADFAEFFTSANAVEARSGRFELLERRLSFGSFLWSWPARLICAVGGVRFWERYFCFIWRARNIHVKLRVVKRDGP